MFVFEKVVNLVREPFHPEDAHAVAHGLKTVGTLQDFMDGDSMALMK